MTWERQRTEVQKTDMPEMSETACAKAREETGYRRDLQRRSKLPGNAGDSVTEAGLQREGSWQFFFSKF